MSISALGLFWRWQVLGFTETEVKQTAFSASRSNFTCTGHRNLSSGAIEFYHELGVYVGSHAIAACPEAT